jgi:hypothetical protein
MKRQTAVEWFAERISHGGLVSKKQFNELIEQAKEMEKQQILYANNRGWKVGREDIGETAEQYYNETFKQ